MHYFHVLWVCSCKAIWIAGSITTKPDPHFVGRSENSTSGEKQDHAVKACAAAGAPAMSAQRGRKSDHQIVGKFWKSWWWSWYQNSEWQIPFLKDFLLVSCLQCLHSWTKKRCFSSKCCLSRLIFNSRGILNLVFCWHSFPFPGFHFRQKGAWALELWDHWVWIAEGDESEGAMQT